MSTSETAIAIMAFLILAFVTSIPLFENYKKYSLFKRIYITIAVALLFIIGSFDVYLKCTNPSESDIVLGAIRKLESAIGIKIKSAIPKPDTSKKIHVETQTPNIKSKHNSFAYLRLSSKSDGFTPIITKKNKADSISMDYKIMNNGTGEAFNIKMFTILSGIRNGKIYNFSPLKINSFDSSIALYPSKTQGQPATTLITLADAPIDSTFVCLKIDFTDSTKRRKSLMRIYQINHDPLYLKEVEDSLSRELKGYLIEKKVWKPPFKQ